MILLKENYTLRGDSEDVRAEKYEKRLEWMRCVAKEDMTVYQIVNKNPDGSYLSYDEDVTVLYKIGEPLPPIDIKPYSMYVSEDCDRSIFMDYIHKTGIMGTTKGYQLDQHYIFIDKGYIAAESMDYWSLGGAEKLGKVNDDGRCPVLMKLAIPKGTVYYQDGYFSKDYVAETMTPVSVININVTEIF